MRVRNPGIKRQKPPISRQVSLFIGQKYQKTNNRPQGYLRAIFCGEYWKRTNCSTPY